MAHLGVLGTVTGHLQRSTANNVVRVAQTKGVAAQAEVMHTAPSIIHPTYVTHNGTTVACDLWVHFEGFACG